MDRNIKSTKVMAFIGGFIFTVLCALLFYGFLVQKKEPVMDKYIVEKIKTMDREAVMMENARLEKQIAGVTYYVIGDKSEGYKSITYFETDKASCIIARGGGLSCKFN